MNDRDRPVVWGAAINPPDGGRKLPRYAWIGLLLMVVSEGGMLAGIGLTQERRCG